MTYDPKNRSPYLVFEHDRTNPNRLKQGVLSVADDKQNEIIPVPKPPTTLQNIMHISKLVALVLTGLAATVIAVQAQGVVLPPWLTGLATTIIAIGATLGISSSGIKKPEAPADPDQLK